MQKCELIDKLAERTGLPKTKCEAALAALVVIIHEALVSGEEVAIPNLGKFSVADVAEREGRNPRTGEPMTIPDSKKVKFAPAKALKDAVKG